MQRRLFNLLAAVSLVICLLLLSFWWRSWICFDQLTLSKDRQYFLTSNLGWITVGWSFCDDGVLIGYPTGGVGVRPVAPGIYAPRTTLKWNNSETEDQPAFDRWGQYDVMTYGAPLASQPRVHHVIAIGAPYWLLTLLAAAAAGTWSVGFVLRRRAQRRKGEGLCIHCAYDLRASKDRCPECGTAIPADLPRGTMPA